MDNFISKGIEKKHIRRDMPQESGFAGTDAQEAGEYDSGAAHRLLMDGVVSRYAAVVLLDGGALYRKMGYDEKTA